MKIYLARHGQTTGDVENRYGGDYDDHLTETGQQQSVKLAEQLADKGIKKLYASPRIRAQETAAVIADKLGLVAETLNDFRERNGYGVLTGMTKDEALKKYPDQVELLKDVHNAVSSAEEYIPFQRRIAEALASLGDKGAETVAVVTHGGPIRLIFRDILKLCEIEIDDCAYAVLATDDNQSYVLLSKSGIEIK